MQVLRIYYSKESGVPFFDTNVMDNSVQTIETDISTFTLLNERNRDSFDILELPFGAYAQDFSECNGYRVNPTTKTLEFSYPDPNTPTTEPVYQKPLSEQVKELETQLSQTNTDLQGFMDFYFNGGAV